MLSQFLLWNILKNLSTLPITNFHPGACGTYTPGCGYGPGLSQEASRIPDSIPGPAAGLAAPGRCPFSWQKHKRPSPSHKKPRNPHWHMVCDMLFCWSKHKAKPGLRVASSSRRNADSLHRRAVSHRSHRCDSFEGWNHEIGGRVISPLMFYKHSLMF